MLLLKKLTLDKFFLLAFIAAPLYWSSIVMLEQWHWFKSSIEWRLLFFVVIAYPIVEELCFRGFLQEQLLTQNFAKQQYFQITLANVLCSIAFVALHGIYHTWSFALMVFVPSLIFGFFRDRYQSVIPGIMLHCWYNSGTFWFLNLWLAF